MKNKIVGTLCFIGIILICAIIFGVCAKLDVGGFATNALAPIISDVPGIRNILPANLQEKSLDEIIAQDNINQQMQIASEEAKKAQAEAEKMSEEAAIEASKAEAKAQQEAELKAQEKAQAAEEARVKAQEQAKVQAEEQAKAEADAQAKQEAEAKAAEAERKAQEDKAAQDEALADYVSTYANMKAQDAAAIFDNMMDGKSSTVVKILANMPADKRAAIMACMDLDNVTQITVLMEKELP